MANEAEAAVAAAIVVQGGRVLLVRRRVAEGALSWQFPAEEGPTRGDSRRSRSARNPGGDRAPGDPAERARTTGSPHDGPGNRYIACRLVGSEALIASDEEVADLAGAAHGEIPQYVPYGLFEPVRDYLDAALLP
ncbi:hypothetical protein GCM10009716_43350 [Streptomyces sodiiphilus]|uniref:NUDIX hydrolase n=1 Tax=Streptomyces sodiiphilus TaxID=226217 RepID=A0ABP5B531_9ACTN